MPGIVRAGADAAEARVAQLPRRPLGEVDVRRVDCRVADHVDPGVLDGVLRDRRHADRDLLLVFRLLLGGHGDGRHLKTERRIVLGRCGWRWGAAAPCIAAGHASATTARPACGLHRRRGHQTARKHAKHERQKEDRNPMGTSAPLCIRLRPAPTWDLFTESPNCGLQAQEIVRCDSKRDRALGPGGPRFRGYATRRCSQLAVVDPSHAASAISQAP